MADIDQRSGETDPNSRRVGDRMKSEHHHRQMSGMNIDIFPCANMPLFVDGTTGARTGMLTHGVHGTQSPETRTDGDPKHLSGLQQPRQTGLNAGTYVAAQGGGGGVGGFLPRAVLPLWRRVRMLRKGGL